MNNVRVRVYQPNFKLDGSRPAMIFMHGRGYVIGNFSFYDSYLREIVKKLNITAISIE